MAPLCVRRLKRIASDKLCPYIHKNRPCLSYSCFAELVSGSYRRSRLGKLERLSPSFFLFCFSYLNTCQFQKGKKWKTFF